MYAPSTVKRGIHYLLIPKGSVTANIFPPGYPVCDVCCADDIHVPVAINISSVNRSCCVEIVRDDLFLPFDGWWHGFQRFDVTDDAFILGINAAGDLVQTIPAVGSPTDTVIDVDLVDSIADPPAVTDDDVTVDVIPHRPFEIEILLQHSEPVIDVGVLIPVLNVHDILVAEIVTQGGHNDIDIGEEDT